MPAATNRRKARGAPARPGPGRERVPAPEAHDAAYAAVSHLPHLIAFALMNAIHEQKQGQEFLSLAGPGFRDFTRIAASDPSVWRDILMSNKEELLAQSKQFQRALHALEVAISAGNPDALEALIDTASSTPAHWRPSLKHNGPPRRPN